MDIKTLRYPAHGGCGLTNRFLPDRSDIVLPHASKVSKSYVISDADISLFYRIADGTLSPLNGPMPSAEFYKVLDEERLERNGVNYAWTIPIAFPVHKDQAQKLREGETIIVKTERGNTIGFLEISDIYYFDKTKYNKVVYGTDRADHPGPRIVNNDPRDYLLGGKIFALPAARDLSYNHLLIAPQACRMIFEQKHWQRVVAFQTRNPLHRAHEYAMVYAMEKLAKEGFFTGVILNPLVGETKSDDVPASVRIKTYQALMDQRIIGQGDTDELFWKSQRYAFMDNLLLIALDMKMYYAGPKEAIMHAIYRQNLGFSDIIIGRKHADAPCDDGTNLWGDFDAQEKFHSVRGELLIKPLNVGAAAYFEELGKVTLIDEVKDKGMHQISIAGKELRKRLESGDMVDERIMRAPVARILVDFYQKKGESGACAQCSNITWHQSRVDKAQREKKGNQKGACLWLTGLSGSGKSTIAVALEEALFNKDNNVYILDGDNIRHGLNKNLGFSPQDREENIRRIAEVAKLFADAGFLVITAFISPYRKDRDNARSLFDPGAFIEIFVKTSLATCEHRDTKGLYKKARAGELKEFTGISAPYEEPLNADLIIDTEKFSIEECRDLIIRHLTTQKYIK